ncbi:LytR/AlgR family response regulator transcription factor [Empedobacter brevis]|uniref:LytR/AlgR family response regulator transcription factor n=1 Tax=Empedobacter brevis TaxID=247 RepID=UPI0028A09E68|nr:response regulator transcription factor [Empedobacter brevis]
MNKRLSCIIVDDEPPAIRILQKYAEQLSDLECVAVTNKAIETLELVNKYNPDILFLDIQMPELTGIQLSTLLKGKVNIIFTTAYSQFALEGYELNVTDYLLKPISFDRFIRAVEKVRQQVQFSSKNERSTESDGYFFVKTDGKNRFKKIKLSDICYLESIKNYVILHTETEQIVTYNTLKYYEENLPESQFVKIHKSFLVSFHKIEKTDTNEVWILGKGLSLGETYKNLFFEKINHRLL